jgi:hypothetical protein
MNRSHNTSVWTVDSWHGKDASTASLEHVAGTDQYAASGTTAAGASTTRHATAMMYTRSSWLSRRITLWWSHSDHLSAPCPAPSLCCCCDPFSPLFSWLTSLVVCCLPSEYGCRMLVHSVIYRQLFGLYILVDKWSDIFWYSFAITIVCHVMVYFWSLSDETCLHDCRMLVQSVIYRQLSEPYILVDEWSDILCYSFAVTIVWTVMVEF